MRKYKTTRFFFFLKLIVIIFEIPLITELHSVTVSVSSIRLCLVSLNKFKLFDTSNHFIWKKLNCYVQYIKKIMSSVLRHFFLLFKFISYGPVMKNRKIHTLPEHSCTAFSRRQIKTYYIIIITYSSSLLSDIKAKPVGLIFDNRDIKNWSQTHDKCVYSSVRVYSFYITIND